MTIAQSRRCTDQLFDWKRAPRLTRPTVFVVSEYVNRRSSAVPLATCIHAPYHGLVPIRRSKNTGPTILRPCPPEPDIRRTAFSLGIRVTDHYCGPNQYFSPRRPNSAKVEKRGALHRYVLRNMSSFFDNKARAAARAASSASSKAAPAAVVAHRMQPWVGG